MSITYRIDPITSYVYISYPSPDLSTEEITVRSPIGKVEGFADKYRYGGKSWKRILGLVALGVAVEAGYTVP
jgi:hypothetical protein